MILTQVAPRDFAKFIKGVKFVVWAISCLARKCMHFKCPIKAFFCIDTTVSKHAEIPPCFSTKTRVLSTRIASLWQLLSRCSLRLCRVIVLHGTSTHTALPSAARTGLQLVLQQMLHNTIVFGYHQPRKIARPRLVDPCPSMLRSTWVSAGSGRRPFFSS